MKQVKIILKQIEILTSSVQESNSQKRRELKLNEKRVSIIPEDVLLLTNNNFTVYVQTNAGKEAQFNDEEYIKAGTIICNSIEELYKKSNIIVKVKEPQEEEYKFIKNTHKILIF